MTVEVLYELKFDLNNTNLIEAIIEVTVIDYKIIDEEDNVFAHIVVEDLTYLDTKITSLDGNILTKQHTIMLSTVCNYEKPVANLLQSIIKQKNERRDN